MNHLRLVAIVRGAIGMFQHNDRRLAENCRRGILVRDGRLVHHA